MEKLFACLSPFAVQELNKCLGIPEHVVHGMMIVFLTETLPLLGASEITHQPCIEVDDPSP
ncbi:MAG: hypothetical protein ACREA0_34405 [bacterium]